MRRYLMICTALLGVSYIGHAQVGIGTKTPSSSAMLEIKAEKKGVLIPRVALTDLNSFSPIEGNANDRNVIGLLVYNTSPNMGPTSLTGSEGFYYWTGTSWNKIASSTELTTLIENNNTQSTEKIIEVTKIIDNLIKTDEVTSSVVLYDSVTKEFYTLVKKGNTITREPLDIKDAIQKLETKTYLTRSEVLENGKRPTGVEVVSFDETKLKKGHIFYEYFGEEKDNNGKAKPQYIDMTSDVLNTIQNNEEIKNAIFNTVNNFSADGGNVYFGDHDSNKETPDALYTVDKEGKKTVLDLGHTIKEILTKESKILTEIREGLGYNISNEVKHTGNKFEGKSILTYAAYTTVKDLDADTSGVSLPIDYQGKKVEVVDIAVYNSKNQLEKVGITDVDIKADKIDFALGSGILYTTLPAGSYKVVVQFVVAK